MFQLNINPTSIDWEKLNLLKESLKENIPIRRPNLLKKKQTKNKPLPKQLNSDVVSEVYQCIKTKVTGRHKNFVTLEYEDYRLDLDKIKYDFDPEENDYVHAKCVKYASMNFDDFAEQPKIQRIISLRPCKLNCTIGIVTSTCADYSVIDDIVLYRHSKASDDEYRPLAGDTVFYEAVESDQNSFLYRCTKIDRNTPDDSIISSYYAKNFFEKNCGSIVSGPMRMESPALNSIHAYNVPETLFTNMFNTQNTNEELNLVKRYLPQLEAKLNVENYRAVFHALLYLEEIENFRQMREYDMDVAQLEREGDYLTLFIPDLAHRRPTLTIGDSVIASAIDKSPDCAYHSFASFIHKTEENKIYLKFDETFHKAYNGEHCKLYFQFSRMTYRRMHHAVRLACESESPILFPYKISVNDSLQLDVSLNEEKQIKCNKSAVILPWFNANLNVMQKQAITQILRGETRPLPYIIFGPPGTGKTMTIVELVLQLSTAITSSRIIIGTSTNTAANVLVEQLVQTGVLKNSDFVRLVSHNLVEQGRIPNSIAPYCATIDSSKASREMSKTGVRVVSPDYGFNKFKIIIGTCMTLGTLLQQPKDHFTHIIIDDAGQCLEPEVHIPFQFINKISGQIILAGDPKQLDPIVLNTVAKQKGLSQSYLVRLLSMPPYQTNENNKYDPRMVTKLLFNYRSIPSLLKIYNSMFYNSELVPMISNTNSEEIKELARLADIFPQSKNRNLKNGLYFYPVESQCMQHPRSTSFYNIKEAELVLEVVEKLYGKDVSSERIGVITPYRSQIDAIQNLFESKNQQSPKIGSTEEFQGQQKDIIILSTVRSPSLNKSLFRFLVEPKRLNVAISRATTLLIVIGNPQTLSFDANWKRIIENSKTNHTFMH